VLEAIRKAAVAVATPTCMCTTNRLTLIYETHRFAREIFDRLAAATRGSGAKMTSADRFNSDLGTVALVSSAKSMAPLTYSCWVGATLSALVRFSPTLTMVALDIRTAEHILD
jgi:hypothetical protein